MKLIVKIGGVRTNDGSFTVGQVFELDSEQAQSLLKLGLVEEVYESKKDKIDPDPGKPKVKKYQPKAKPAVKPVVKPPKKADKPANTPVEEVKPSLDWTPKELIEYGASKGIEGLENLTKEEMLEAINGGGEK